MISTRMELAFGLLRCIASNEITSVPNMTEATGKSISCIEQTISPLRRAGIISSVRGPAGGYKLSRPLSEVRLSDLASALGIPRKSDSNLLTALLPDISDLTLAQLSERLN